VRVRRFESLGVKDGWSALSVVESTEYCSLVKCGEAEGKGLGGIAQWVVWFGSAERPNGVAQSGCG
jgi:hypothetical protein